MMPAVPPPETPTPRDDCPNCGHVWGAGRLNYCPSCGQETELRPPTVGEFLQQFAGSYIATEGALWRTLKLLLLKPGKLTREYLDGRRRRYLLPLRLYLTISVIVLLLFRLSTTVNAGVGPEVATTGMPKSIEFEIGLGSAGLNDGVFYCKGLPPWLCQRLQRRYDIEPRQLVREITHIGDRFVANLGATMFVLLPTYALWLGLAYRNRRLRYTEHLVFALHVHAFWFLMLGATLPGFEWVSMLAMLAVPVYSLLALRQVYGGRWWPLLLRAGAISALYGVSLGLAFAATAMVLIVF